MKQKFNKRKNRNEDQSSQITKMKQDVLNKAQIAVSTLHRDFNNREKTNLYEEIKKG